MTSKKATPKTNSTAPTAEDQRFMDMAIEQAQIGFDGGGVPVGSVLVRKGIVLAIGHNKRVQEGDPIAHGEMDCLRNAGRQKTYRDTTLYTTLSPCMMCSGTIVQFAIPRVVIGDNTTFGGNEAFLRERGVEVLVMDDPKARDLMLRFQRERPEIWNEDIGASA